ncbi:MAG TPA: lipid-A-disaccharide synthase [Caldimonas sp.]|jgi:lipid-A-disaccharide synthase|nr:lipid-A-disaccharide synthase [Caldimonas sp.]HEV7578173.1 lipid-A-disaccharide synthase [Caldimonas sp.]
MIPDVPCFAMVAGEASGDVLAGALLASLRARWPDLAAEGIGGPSMAEQGFTAWWPHHKLSLHGYAEVLGHLREILSIRSQLLERLLADKPDAFVGIDAPDFNLDVELKLRAAGIKTIHFVSPSIWAWRGKRIEKIGRAADLVLCIFPFEPEIYAKRKINAVYVGHPLASAIPFEVPRTASRAALGVGADETLVALLPGSRRAEIQYIAPRLFGAAAEMSRARPGLRFVVPVVTGLRHAVEPLRKQYAPDAAITLLDGRAHEALAACDVALVASGTATLEAALFKRPMVVVYVMHALNWQMGKRMNYQPWVALPNILLRDFAVPELLQGDATPAKIAAAAFEWLDDPAAVEALRVRFEAIHRDLQRDTGALATAAIEAVLAA